MMNKIVVLLIEFCFIIGGGFAANAFVNEVLDPDYTVHMLSREEAAALGRGIPPDKEVYKADIMRKRKTDKLVIFLLYGLLVAGYYCLKTAHNEVKRRGKIIPADGTKTLSLATVASNRYIVFFRFLGFLLILIVLGTTTSIVYSHPMQNLNEEGRVVITNANFGGDDILSKVLIVMYMPIALCFGAYFAFRKITDIFSLKFASLLFLTLLIIMGIGWLLKIPIYATSLFASAFAGLGIFGSFIRKMDAVAVTLGMGTKQNHKNI